MKRLPEEFTRRMKLLLKEEYPPFEEAINREPVRAFRVNTDKISVEDFLKTGEFPADKIPYSDTGFYLTAEHIGLHPFHHAGMIYVQEPGAMAPAECLEISPEWRILDMCAAPGGKSTQLKNKLGPEGILVSNEIIPSRCKILTGNIERLGLGNTVTTCLSSDKIAEKFPECFDLIMVDAPCSGEGMFRKDDTVISEWSEDNVNKCAARQREILNNAILALKPGGYIIYATCTFSLEENEMIIDAFLSEHPDFELLPVKREVYESTSGGICFEGCRNANLHFTRRFYPHKSAGEGQFMALLHSTESRISSVKPSPASKDKLDPIITDFLDDTLTHYDKSQVLMQNGKPIYFSPDFPIDGKIAFSCGITIGELKKGYIQPHHQFFMGLGSSFKRKIELTLGSAELKSYLHGEEISTELPNGWAVVTVCGCALGGAKVVNGRAKNHYPKGLRIL